ncbi:MAG: hypothetical protein KAJ19_10540 [Gammaproteobacteria bacterium]|nr:hypothetical protein [Gammaproteobacteria bacterium]
MRLDEITRSDGAVENAIRGLHDAQIGDIVAIGIEGFRTKHMAKIKKVVGQNKLVDTNGNIFNRNGVIYRRVSYPCKSFPGKIVSAKLVSQKSLDDEHEQRKIEYLNGRKWEDVDSETRDKILGLLRVSFTSMQGMKEYK